MRPLLAAKLDMAEVRKRDNYKSCSTMTAARKMSLSLARPDSKGTLKDASVASDIAQTPQVLWILFYLWLTGLA